MLLWNFKKLLNLGNKNNCFWTESFPALMKINPIAKQKFRRH